MISTMMGNFSEEAYFASIHSFFLGRKPKTASKLFNMSYPFSSLTWVFTFIATAFSTVSSMALYILNQRVDRDQKKRGGKDSFLEVAFLPWGILFGEFHFKLFEFGQSVWQGVLLRTVWMVGTFFLILAYQANLKV